jgi:hypothetical protein
MDIHSMDIRAAADSRHSSLYGPTKANRRPHSPYIRCMCDLPTDLPGGNKSRPLSCGLGLFSARREPVASRFAASITTGGLQIREARCGRAVGVDESCKTGPRAGTWSPAPTTGTLCRNAQRHPRGRCSGRQPKAAGRWRSRPGYPGTGYKGDGQPAAGAQGDPGDTGSSGPSIGLIEQSELAQAATSPHARNRPGSI